jgi:SulP family sulfate permease
MRNPKSDITVLVLTFLLTIIFDLTVAIEVGLLCACLLFMRRMAETTDVKVISQEINPEEEDSDFQMGNLEHLTIPAGVEVYEINGPYFFGAGNRFEEIMGVLRHQRQKPRVRIIRMRKVPFVDSTGIHNLTNLCQMSQREGIQVVLSGVNPTVQAVLHKAGFDAMLGQENICSHINIALDRARQLVA